MDPIEVREHIVSEVQEVRSVPADLRVTNDLTVLDQRWERPLIDAYMLEYPQKTANAGQLLDRLERLVPIGRLLDFGCGPGVFLSVARQRGWQVRGLEPLVGFAIFARGRFGLDVENGFLNDETFPVETFDAVTALQVLEHLADPLDSLRRLHRVLRPGGMVVVEVPNIASAWSAALGPRHRHFVEDHLYFFSPDTLERMLRRAGLTVVEQGYNARLISLRSLARQAVSCVSPGLSAPTRGERNGRALPLADMTVSLNLGDIIYACAAKAS